MGGECSNACVSNVRARAKPVEEECLSVQIVCRVCVHILHDPAQVHFRPRDQVTAVMAVVPDQLQ